MYTFYALFTSVDGGWSSWGSFGMCSISCGGGVKTRDRSCTKPRPLNGGKKCPGSAWDKMKCNTHPCRKCRNLLLLNLWSQFCSRQVTDHHKYVNETLKTLHRLIYSNLPKPLQRSVYSIAHDAVKKITFSSKAK